MDYSSETGASAALRPEYHIAQPDHSASSTPPVPAASNPSLTHLNNLHISSRSAVPVTGDNSTGHSNPPISAGVAYDSGKSQHPTNAPSLDVRSLSNNSPSVPSKVSPMSPGAGHDSENPQFLPESASLSVNALPNSGTSNILAPPEIQRHATVVASTSGQPMAVTRADSIEQLPEGLHARSTVADEQYEESDAITGNFSHGSRRDNLRGGGKQADLQIDENDKPSQARRALEALQAHPDVSDKLYWQFQRFVRKDIATKTNTTARNSASSNSAKQPSSANRRVQEIDNRAQLADEEEDEENSDDDEEDEDSDASVEMEDDN